MIQTIVTHTCPKCGSKNMVRNGHDYKGAQKYYCHDYQSYGTLHAQRGHTDHTRDQVKRAVLERLSLRGIERLFGISRRTVLEWIEQWADKLPPLETTLAVAQLDDVLELDEVWSFVLKKTNKRWVWVALCRRTHQIVAYFIGDRSEASCLQLWRRIPAAYKCCHSFSDFWAPINLFSPQIGINRLAKTVAKPTISNAGSIPCVSVWLALFAKPCRFPSRTSSMRSSFDSLSITTI